MLYSKVTPEQKRIRLRELLASGTIAQFPGAFNPLSARLIEEKGFAGELGDGAGGEEFAEPDPLLLRRDLRIQH